VPSQYDLTGSAKPGKHPKASYHSHKTSLTGQLPCKKKILQTNNLGRVDLMLEADSEKHLRYESHHLQIYRFTALLMDPILGIEE
jgi:hypothetical protein